MEQVGESADGFTLATRFDKAVYARGEPIKVNLRFKNEGTSIGIFEHRGSPNDYWLKVTTEDGKVAPLTEYGKQIYNLPKMGSMAQLRLKAGDETKAELIVSRIFDMSATDKYNVSASCDVHDLADLGKHITAKSKTIPIKVEE